MNRLLALFAPLLALAALALPAVAQAAEETHTINFDNLPAETRVTNQYESEGLIFANASSFGFSYGAPPANGVVEVHACGAPFTEAQSATHSPPNDANITCGGGEFFGAGVFAVLTNYAKKISAYVGSPGLSGYVFRLDAYNIAKEYIGHAEVTQSSDGVYTPISFETEGARFEIAYFALYVANPYTSDNYFTGIDDLTLVSGGAPAAVSLSSSAGGRLAQGGQLQREVSIVRHNGSTGNVKLEATGLPAGVHATFSPEVLGGTETKSTLTLGAESSAPLAEATGAIVATPQTIAAGSASGPSSVPDTVAVVPPFDVYVGLASTIPASASISVPPCSTGAVGVRTTIEPGFSPPVDLALATSGATPDVSSLALEKTVLETADFGFVDENEQVLRVTRNATPASGSFDVYVSGSAGPFSEPAATVEVKRAPPTVSSLSAASGRIPQSLQPGTPVTISGAGFCPGSTVTFGNSDGVATPTSINPQGTQLTVNVPPLATSGSVTVTSAGASGTAPTPMNIDTYRNVNGYQFHNYDPSIDFEQLTDAFGENQTYDTIDLCWPFGCNIKFRDPFAMLLNAFANATLDSGACFGISLSSQRFLEGDRFLDEFPPGHASSIFGLDARSGPSGELTNFINAMHVSQLSTEFLGHYLARAAALGIEGGAAGSATIFNEIAEVLRAGRHPLVALAEGTTGHVVVAYNLEGAPGNYSIDVYDSNLPFNEGGNEETEGSHHHDNYIASRISVNSDGEWSLPSSGMHGNINGIVVTDPGQLPLHPTIPTGLGILKALGGIIFGSAGPGNTAQPGATAPAPSTVTQLSNGAGHTLYAANGQINENPATRLGAVPFAPLVGGSGSLGGSGGLLGSGESGGVGVRRAVGHTAAAAKAQPGQVILLPPGAGALQETVTGTGTGPDTHTLLGPSFAGQISTQAAKGVSDTLTLSPSGGTLGFSTQAAHKPLTLTLLGTAGKERRSAQIATTSFAGAGDSAAFTGGQSGLSFTHHGRATTFSLTLSAQGPHSAPAVFQSGSLHVGVGAHVRVGAIRWSGLAGSALRVTIGRHTLTVRNRLHVPRLASIAKLAAKKGSQGTVALTIDAKLNHLPAGEQVAFVWTVRSGHRVVATHAMLGSLLSGSQCDAAIVHGICAIPKYLRPAIYTFTFKPPRHGSYTLTASVTAITISGVTQSASRATRTLRFKA
jgi:hypothetical protein